MLFSPFLLKIGSESLWHALGDCLKHHTELNKTLTTRLHEMQHQTTVHYGLETLQCQLFIIQVKIPVNQK